MIERGGVLGHCLHANLCVGVCMCDTDWVTVVKVTAAK